MRDASRNATPMEFDYVAPLLRSSEGMIQHYIPVPDEIADAIEAAPTRRLIIELNGRTYRRALRRRKTGERYLMIGQHVVKEIRAAIGETVRVRIRLDPDPDHVEVPEEFAVALEQEPEASERFDSMTPGMQRSLALYVSSAKRVETRIKRSLELAHKLKTYTLHGDRQRKAKN